MISSLHNIQQTYSLALQYWHTRTTARYHSLLGRGRRVLMATGFLYGNHWFSTASSPQLQPLLTDHQKNCHRWLHRQQLSQNQTLCKSAYRGFLSRRVKYNQFFLFICSLFFQTHLQAIPVGGFSYWMAQTMWIRTRVRLFGVSFIQTSI